MSCLSFSSSFWGVEWGFFMLSSLTLLFHQEVDISLKKGLSRPAISLPVHKHFFDYPKESSFDFQSTRKTGLIFLKGL